MIGGSRLPAPRCHAISFHPPGESSLLPTLSWQFIKRVRGWSAIHPSGIGKEEESARSFPSAFFSIESPSKHEGERERSRANLPPAERRRWRRGNG